MSQIKTKQSQINIVKEKSPNLMGKLTVRPT